MSEGVAQAAFGLFKEELHSEELCVRVNTIRRLPLVVHLVEGSPTHKDTLLAFLDGLIDTSDDDEVIFGLADGLFALSSYFPLTKLLGLYEKLLSSEETIVRDKTVESFLKMTKKLDRGETAAMIIPFVLKQTSNQSFGTKMSVLSIMSEIFPVLSAEEKRMFLEKLGALFAEESLVLRRNLAGKLGKICQHLPKEILTGEIFNHFKNLTNDDSDSVRIISIESLIELSKVFNDEENKTFVIPLIIQMTGDKSWRVRHHLAKSFANLGGAVGKEISDNSLTHIFSTLLRDQENEVRIASVQSLRKFVLCLNLDKILQIFAYLQSLAKDAIPLVRVGVCEVMQVILSQDLEQIGKDVCKTKVQPILADLVQDKDTEVKIETMRVLPLWTKWVGSFVFEQISNGGLAVVLESPNWRIRSAILDAYVSMAAELKNAKLFDKYARKVLVGGIHDKVFQVRKQVIKSLPRMGGFLDDAATTEIFFKEYTKVLGDHALFYTFRVSALYGLEAVVGMLQNKDKVKDSYLKLLLKTSEDANVNIRFVAIKILIKAARTKPFSEVMDAVRKLVAKLKESEKDAETKFILDEFGK